jgi:dienelactone hydrolase
MKKIAQELLKIAKELASIKEPDHMFPHNKAEELAKKNQKDDPEWTYKAVPNPKKHGFSFVEIYDEDGKHVGNL